MRDLSYLNQRSDPVAPMVWSVTVLKVLPTHQIHSQTFAGIAWIVRTRRPWKLYRIGLATGQPSRHRSKQESAFAIKAV